MKRSLGGRLRRRVEHEATPGRCGNLDYCSIGMQRLMLNVPLSEAFICPECGGPLRAPYGNAIAGRPIILPMLRLTVLFAAMAVSLGTGYAIGRVQHGVATAVAAVAASLDSKPHEAKTIAGQAKSVLSAPPMLVAERAYPAHASSVEVSKPAPRLAHETPFGQVTMDCLLDARTVHPSCQITDVRGADAFSAAAAVWLQSLAIQYGLGSHEGTPASLSHRWRVIFEDFSGTPRPARGAR